LRRLQFALVCCAAILCSCAGTGVTTQVAPSAAANNPLFTKMFSAIGPTQKARSGIRRHFVSPSATKAGLYVALFNASYLLGYNGGNRKNRLPYCGVVGGNGVLFVRTDSQGTVWVPVFYLGLVESYASNCGAQGITLNASGIEPWSIAIDNTGAKYVAGDAYGNGCWIYKYANGSATPSTFLSADGLSDCLDVATDSKGNVFAATQDDSVYMFRRGQMPGKQLALLQEPSDSGMTFDKKDNLIMPDRTNGRIDVWSPPYKANPKTFPLTDSSVFACALNKAETRLACSVQDGSQGAVDFYDYPSGKYLYSFNAGLYENSGPTGLAFYSGGE
jgi:hypothetical protein